MAETIEVRGLENTLRLLESLPAEIVSRRGGPVKSALRKAGLVIQKEWREQIQRIIDEPNIGGVNYSTGLYQKSVIVSRDPRPLQNGANERYLVRVKRGKYRDGTSVKAVASFLEGGTEHMQAKAPMRKAFDAKKHAAVDTFVTEVNKAIERVIKKLERTAKT